MPISSCFSFSSFWNANLNIGAARLALVASLWAESQKGKFYLFNDDVDEVNRLPASRLAQLLSWLGIKHHLGPYFNRHQEHVYRLKVHELLRCGAAYKDFATTEEIREEQLLCKDSRFVYSRKWMADTKEKEAAFLAEGRTLKVRLKMPREKHVVSITDKVMGKLEFDLSQENDHIICIGNNENARFTSYFTTFCNHNYHAISMIFNDLSGIKMLPTHIFLAKNLKLKLPDYAHIPSLLDPISNSRFSEKNLSRQMQQAEFSMLYTKAYRIANETGVIGLNGEFHPCFLTFYQDVGFLPSVVRHYLLASVLSKSSYVRTKRTFNDYDLASACDVRNFSRTPEHFSVKVLLNLQWMYMQNLPMIEKAWLINEFLQKSGMSKFYPSAYYNKPVPKELLGTAERLSSHLQLGGEVLLTPHTMYSEDMQNHIATIGHLG